MIGHSFTNKVQSDKTPSTTFFPPRSCAGVSVVSPVALLAMSVCNRILRFPSIALLNKPELVSRYDGSGIEQR